MRRFNVFSKIGIFTSLLTYILLSYSVPSTNAAIKTVISTADSGAGSLRQAIIEASAGDTIQFSLVYPATIVLTSGSLSINKHITISGPGREDLTLSGNDASRVFFIGSESTVSLTSFSITNGTWERDHRDDDFGGCIFLNNGSLSISDAVISNCTADFGGGIYNNSGDIFLTDVTMSNNTATIRGGALYNYAGTTDIDQSTINNNTASNSGGGLINYSAAAVMDIASSIITGNTSTNFNGGGILNELGTLTVSDTEISGNAADNDGGGIYNAENGTLTLSQSTVTDNSVAEYSGGGLYNFGDATVSFSTFSNNQASSWGGGGIHNVSEGTLAISLSTFSNNSARGGGGISSQGICTITDSTITNNYAGDWGGGGVSHGGSTLTLQNTILADNRSSSASTDCNGTVTSDGYNLIENSSNCTIAGDTSTSIIGQDPKLGSLQDNGGPTFTHGLLAQSPALEAGTCINSSDQRGYSRPVGANCDIGAYETETAYQLTVEKSGNGTGTVVSDRGSLDCGSTCSDSFAVGSLITLTAQADPGYSFTGWSGDCDAQGKVTMSGDKTCSANFSAVWSVTPSSGPQGGIDPSAEQTVYHESSVSFTIIPALNYHVVTPVGGTCGGSYTGNPKDSVNGIVFTTAPVTGNCTVGATYSINTYSLKYASGTNGKLEGDINQTVEHGGSGTTVTAVPDQWYHFSQWSDGSPENPRTDNSVTADIDVQAVFARDSFLLTVSHTGSGEGLVSSSPTGISCGSNCETTFDSPTSVTLTASAEDGSVFMGWSGDCSYSDNESCELTMNDSRSVTAEFKRNFPWLVLQPALTYHGIQKTKDAAEDKGLQNPSLDGF